MRTDSRAKPRLIRVRGILPPSLAALVEVIAQFSAANLEKRSYNCASTRRINNRIDAGQAGGSGSSDDMRQNGFCLIVGGMSNGNALRFSVGENPIEKCVPQTSRRLFQIPTVLRRCRPHIFARAHKFQPACPRQFFNEAGVAIRFVAAQHVIEMDHDERDSEFVAKRFEQTQQRYRIGAAGDGNANAVTG